MNTQLSVKLFFLLFLFVYTSSLSAEEYIVRYPQLGIKTHWDKSANMVIVEDVKKDANVYKAGIRPGDAISMIGMSAATSMMGVKYAILDLTPGKTEKITYKRNGEVKETQFIVETKEYKTFYNNDLTKHKFPRTDNESMLHHGITRSGFSRYLQYISNYIKLLEKVETGEFDPEVAAFSAISGFYYLHDAGKKTKIHKDVYAAVNKRFYDALILISAKISNDFKNSKIKRTDANLVNFINIIFENYYLPNYDDLPDIQNQTANLNAMKEILVKFEAKALKKK
jgi:hypothetical protein